MKACEKIFNRKTNRKSNKVDSTLKLRSRIFSIITNRKQNEDYSRVRLGSK